MNEDDNRFFTVPQNDPYLEMWMGDRNIQQYNEQPDSQGSMDQEKPFDLSLFQPDERNIKIQERPMDRMMAEEQEKKLQTKKKMKSTYAFKIAKLMHQDPSQVNGDSEERAQQRQPRGESQQDNSQNEQAKEDKLLKNRLSAQKSRKSKKQYMELLEQRVQMLQKELQEAKTTIERQNEIIKRYGHTESITQGYIVTKQQLFDKLERLIESSSRVDEEELNTFIDSLRLRFGATGKQRVTLIEYYLKQICDFMIPDVHKYVLYAASKGNDIFSGNLEGLGQESEIYKQMNISSKDKKFIDMRFRNQMLQQTHIISMLFQELFTVKQRIQQHIRGIQMTFDEMRKYIPASGLSKLIMNLEKNKYRKDISKIWQYWDNIVEQHMDKTAEVIRKQIKKLQQ